jgi:hypothetical protein
LQRVTRRRQYLANQVAIRHASELLNESSDFQSICKHLKDTLQPIGFDAVLFRRLGPNGFSADSLRPLSYTSDGSSWLFSWADTEILEAAWELKLQLVTGVNGSAEKWGYFSLIRTQNAEPLLFDMNLLTEEFLKALSAAVQRASIRLDTDRRVKTYAAGSIRTN